MARTRREKTSRPSLHKPRGGFSLGGTTGAAALLVAGLGVGGAWPAMAAESETCTPTEGFTDCRIFDHTGTAVDFQVPAGVETLDVRAWGMGGDGNAFANGGAAAYVAGSLDVTPSEHLSVKVGGWYQGGKYFGDALGGKGGSGSWGQRGGASTGVRAADGSALFIAAGGGGGGLGVRATGNAGSGGTTDGEDAQEQNLGGKGAKGAQGGAAGGEGGSAGANAAQGGAGGDGGTDAGGGGAGYAGGGGGAGKNAAADSGSGGGGSSYADPERVSGIRMLASTTSFPPAKDDPFWTNDPYGEQSPVLSGVGEGGPGQQGGGDGRVVFQWKAPEDSAAQVAALTRESGDDQSILPNSVSDPLAVVARDKDGEPVPGKKVTFALEDPNGLGVKWDDGPAEVTTDDQGRAESPGLISGAKEGDFTVRATSGSLSTTFTAHVKAGIYSIEITGGDEQEAGPGEAFADPLSVKVAKPGASVADTPVEFSVEGDAEGAPVFEGDERTASVTTNGRGEVSAPALTAGTEEGTYTVVATVGEATARFTLEVTGDEATASPSPSPSGTSETIISGSDTQGGSGSLALTGAAGIGTLAALAAALTALGWAALRYAPRLRTRFRSNG